MENRNGWTGYADFYKASSYAAFPQQHRHSPGRLSFHMIMVDQGAHAFLDPAVPETILALPLSASQDCTWSWDMGNGWHPYRWLMTRRVERAKELLVRSDLGLAQISDICGFADQSHLTKVLKQATGATPLRWRQNHRTA